MGRCGSGTPSLGQRSELPASEMPANATPVPQRLGRRAVGMALEGAAVGVGDLRGGVGEELGVPSAVEHRPADVVSQPLIVKDEFADRIRELFALPPALEPASTLFASGGRRTRRFDRVGGSTELVRGDVRHRCCLAGCIGGMPSGSAQLSCRTHGMATRRTGLRHPDVAARPRPYLLDRLAGPRIRRLHRLEEVQNVLCARGRPQSEEPMVGVRERPTATDGDEAGVAGLGEDHG
jgi:hypothetical protein